MWAGRLALRSHIVLDQEFSFLFWWVSVRRVRRVPPPPVPPPPVKPFRRIAASFFFPPGFLSLFVDYVLYLVIEKSVSLLESVAGRPRKHVYLLRRRAENVTLDIIVR